MNNVLKVDASMRKHGSLTRSLVDELLNTLTLNKARPLNITHRDLANGIPFINGSWIDANFTQPSQRSVEQQASLRQSDSLVNELKNADIIVMGVPIYNFHVPAAFKAWIDLVARAGETFRYTENGPVGLLKDKKAYVVVASGGTQLGSPIDFISAYLQHVLGFIGIQDVTLIDASQGNKDNAIEQIQALTTTPIALAQ